ncbi:uncharacterized protein LOC141667618 [Apium graveolens]|uniref:uncharacterized protein LOC141667618 n=1 Tax=Apium graveolens TaxID=4045 RepID=UPI003D7938B2
MNRYNSRNNSFAHNLSGTLGPREGEFYNVTNPMVQGYGERNFGSSKISEARSTFPSGQTVPQNGGISQRSTPFTRSFSPSRYQMEGEYDPRKLITMADIGDRCSSLKKDLVVKIRENEVEISQLRKHLAEYSVKEAEEERSTFVSSLSTVISECISKAPDDDAQSIVGNLKIIFKHLQEQLIITETKLKDSQYQMPPWRPDIKLTSYVQSPSHSSLNNGLGLVPQPSWIFKGESVVPSGPSKVRDWDILDNDQSNISGFTKTLETDVFTLSSR